MAAQNPQVSTFRRIYYRIIPLSQVGEQTQVSTMRQIYAEASTTTNPPSSGIAGVSTMRKLYAIPVAAIITPPGPLTVGTPTVTPISGTAKVTTFIYAVTVSGGVPFTTGDKYHYQWTWTNSAGGPGNSSGGKNPNITFQFPGTWSGVLEVIDSLGTFGVAGPHEAQANIPSVTVTGSPVISITSATPATGVAGNGQSYVFTIIGKSFNAAGQGIAGETVYLFESANPAGPWTEIQSTTTAGSGGGTLGQFTFAVSIAQPGTTYYEVSDTNPPS